MTGETSWTECATQVMEGQDQVWFTVQAIVTEIRERKMKPSAHRLPANEACRSLRSCLRHHAMKDNGRFVRKHSNSLILYALRKKRHQKPQTKRLVSGGRHKISSSCDPPPVPSPPLPHTPSPTSRPTIVEVDDPNIPKPYRPRHPRDWTQPGFLLPSPCLSLLGARKTLSLLSAGDSARPVRKTRGRGLGERARDRVHTVGPPETSPVDTSQHTCSSREDVIGSEELCSVPAYCSDVVFLKSPYSSEDKSPCSDGSPASVQGDRDSRVLCEVDPNLPVTFDLSSSGSDSSGSESETETCSEGEEPLTPPTTPHITSSPCHHDNQPAPTKTPPTSLTSLAAGRRSEVARRHLTHLLSPSSPLVGETMKVLLGPEAYEGLSTSQRRQLLPLLPPVDTLSCDRLQPVALSNSFFGSACREWQDHLALGLHSNTGGRGARVEKKARNHDNASWKDQFFECHWGERMCEPVTGGEAVFFPSYPDTSHPLWLCLTAIMDGYQSAPPPPPPKPSSGEKNTETVPRSGRDDDSHAKSRSRSRPAATRPRKTAAAGGVAGGGREQKQQLNNRNNRHRPAPARRVARSSRNHLVLVKTRRAGGGMYLSPLPHKMSYSALLEALHKASRQPPPPSTLPSDQTPSPALTTLHTHPVFLDHFSTLHPHSVPADFLSPPSSLLVSLPRSNYTAVLAHRAILFEHDYTPVSCGPPPTLPLSLPRSLLSPHSPHTPAQCSSNKLTFCYTCNSLYHENCSHGNLCPSCLTKPAVTKL